MTNTPQDQAAKSRDEILKLLSDTQSHYATYHNHKETSAWAGVVLYVFLLAQLIRGFGNIVPGSCVMRTAMTFGIVAASGIIWVYLCRQFSLCRTGADLVAACFYLRSEIVSKPTEELKADDYAPPSCGDKSTQSSYVLPQIILTKSDELATRGQGSRTTLENCAYIIVAIVSVLGIIKIWVAG